MANFPMRSLHSMAPSYGMRGREGLVLRPAPLWLLTVIDMGTPFSVLMASTGLNVELCIPLLLSMLYRHENVVGDSPTWLLTFPLHGLSSSPHGPNCSFPSGLYVLLIWQVQCTLLYVPGRRMHYRLQPGLLTWNSALCMHTGLTTCA